MSLLNLWERTYVWPLVSGSQPDLVSLLALMEEIDLGNLVGSVSAIANLGQSAPEGLRDALALPERNRQDALHHIEIVIEILTKLNLAASLISAQEVKNILLNEATQGVGEIKLPGEKLVAWPPLSTKRLKQFCREMQTRTRDELLSRKALLISPNKVDFYENSMSLFGANVPQNFPSSAFEIDEAGKTLATGRSTATVFHLMRTMEIAIRAIARKLSIPDPAKAAERNWGVILRKINDAIGKLPPGPDKDFFMSNYALLDAVRNAWRNSTMHVENKYTEQEAEDIFHAVRGFMRAIASRFDENGNSV